MKQGVVYGILAYLMWGLLPVYWKLFKSMGAWEILAHRIVWSLVFVLIIIVITKRWKKMRTAAQGIKLKGALLLCSLLISVNWVLYIWAVNTDQVMETSLGYYINPLISVLLGVMFLKEKLRMGQWIALAMAGLGVLFITVRYGHIPWIALSLAFSFAFYGLAKKMVNLEAIIGLAWETMFVAPIALLYLIMLQVNGTGTTFQLEGWKLALLSLAGVGTALPLYFFAQATIRLPLSTLGFLQYLSPTIQLLSAVFWFGEKFTTVHLISFVLIWGALIVFTVSSIKKTKESKQITPKAVLKQQA